jgi:hypothetical protein
MRTKYHQDNYIPRLHELARRCGIALKPIKTYVDGTAMLIVVNPEDPNGCTCGRYGQAFAEALKECRWRTGEARYGFHRGIWCENGWAWFVEGDLVRALDAAGIPDTSEVAK